MASERLPRVVVLAWEKKASVWLHLYIGKDYENLPYRRVCVSELPCRQYRLLESRYQ